MTKIDPKLYLVAAIALVLAGALGFALARQMPVAGSQPLAVVTIDRIAEQAERDLADLRADRTDLLAKIKTLTDERDEARENLVQFDLAREGGGEISGDETVALADLQAELEVVVSQRDALIGQLEGLQARSAEHAEQVSLLKAELLAQQDALEAAAATRAAEQAAEAAQAAQAAQAAEAAEAAQVAEAEQVAQATAAAPAAPVAAAVPTAEEVNSQAIEVAVERGLKAYQAKDFDTAFQTWQPLADQGVARAQFYVGALYRDGAGVNKDMVQAYVWLKRSNDRGYIYAKGLLDRVSREMTPEQLTAAQAVLGN